MSYSDFQNYLHYKPRIAYNASQGWHLVPSRHPISKGATSRVNAAYWWCKWQNYREYMIAKYGAASETGWEKATHADSWNLLKLLDSYRDAKLKAIRSAKND